MNEEKKICTCCHQEKSLDEFNKKTPNLNTCKSCRQKNSMKSNNTLKGFLKKLIRSAKNNANKRKKDREEVKKVTITYKDLCEIWKNQSGLCYYSSIQMVTITKSDWQCSLERLNTELGYIRENVVLCCLEFNGNGTQWTDNKIKELFTINKIEDDYSSVNFDLVRAKKTWNKKKQEIINDILHIECTYCKIMKEFNEFYKGKNGCKLCIDIKRKEDYETPRGFILHLIQESKVSTNSRDKKKTKQVRNNDHDIDFDYLVELYHQQKGKCAYSGVKLTFGSYKDKSWIGSIERIDPLIGYTKENICLIAYEFNTKDSTCLSDAENVNGSSSWSKDKFKYFEETYYKYNDGLWLEYLSIT
jgi:hypothetical protein